MMKKGLPDKTEVAGTAAAFAAYALWGILPLYWKLLKGVEPMQILAHRVFWAGMFCLALMAVSRRLPEILVLVRNGKKLRLILLASLFACMNWGLYIWAVNSGRVTESALGYFINPLFSVVFGVIFFKEKADRWTKIAVGIACLGIGAAAVVYGSIPWVSILLALTFAFYGVVKKRLGLDPLAGLTVETLAAVPLALLFIVLRQTAGMGAFAARASIWTMVLLCLAGAVTALPLLFFAKAANSISLQKMGFIQYISPTGMLFLGLVVFREKPSPALLVAFAGVIIAVMIYVVSRKRAS
jgi:chloramphenicol-sensitive protein RarD